MNKNNYYYKKLAQSIIFSYCNWKDVVDFDAKENNVFDWDFLKQLYSLVLYYEKMDCLDSHDVRNLQTLLSDLRFSFPYSSKEEKQKVYLFLNQMIDISNNFTGSGIYQFYKEEIKKRYAIYFHSKLLKEVILSISDWDFVKDDLALDVDILAIFYHQPEEILTNENVDFLLLNELLLSTINALTEECPMLLSDPVIHSRFLELLITNRDLLTNKNLKKRVRLENCTFEFKNQLVLNRLENIRKNW